MRRRRKRRWYWLPPQGLDGAGAAAAEAVYWDSFIVPLPAAGGAGTVIRDFTFDHPPDIGSFAASDPMSLFLQKGYMLRRIVGNVYIHLEATSAGGSGTGIQAAAVTYAAFIARESDRIVTPAGAEGGFPDSVENFGPQFVDNSTEPFIFHRNWVIGNNEAVGFGGLKASKFPPNNALYGSAFEGTFVDQKTLRRVDGDNRLWHVVQARHYPLNTTHDGSANIVVTTMLRILGRPISPAKSGAF